MSEFCLSSTTNRQFSSLLISDFFLFCSFILSHPIYLSYLIFFSPYLFKVLSFLSPLFITTSLLLITLLTVSPSLVHGGSAPELSESKVGFPQNAYQTVLERLRSNVDYESEEFLAHRFEELEVYKIVFEASTLEVREIPAEDSELKSEENCSETLDAVVIEHSSFGDFSGGLSEVSICNLEENPVENTQPEVIIHEILGGKTLEGLLQEKDVYENIETCKVEDKEIDTVGAESNKVEENREEPLMSRGSKAMHGQICETMAKVHADNDSEYPSKAMENSQRLGNSDNGGEYTSKVENSQILCPSLGSFGSMRKEKEWKRTLACKLYEERHNVDGGEGMDLLWETYEADSNKGLAKSKTKKGKKSEVEYYDDDEEDEETDGQLCCLQALKFSAGKMNLGMGRPNLMKISKALKGIGWLHHVSRHGKKGYN